MKMNASRRLQLLQSEAIKLQEKQNQLGAKLGSSLGNKIFEQKQTDFYEEQTVNNQFRMSGAIIQQQKYTIDDGMKCKPATQFQDCLVHPLVIQQNQYHSNLRLKQQYQTSIPIQSQTFYQSASGLAGKQSDQYNSGGSIPFHQQYSMKIQQTAIRLEKLEARQNGTPARMLKLKSINLNEEQSLGDTLRQSRVIREHLEQERAYRELEPPSMRIRPATPKLNLLKMRKNLPPSLAGSDQNSIQTATQQQLAKKKKPQLAQLQPLEKLPQLPDLNVEIPETKPKQKKRRIIKDQQINRSENSDQLPLPKSVPFFKEQESSLFKQEEQITDWDQEKDISPMKPVLTQESDDELEREIQSPVKVKDQAEEIDFYRDEEEQSNEFDDEENNEIEYASGIGLLTNFQEKFEEIIQNEDVEDAIDLNEKFLADNLGVPAYELSRLTKIELRVDTSCHNLQVTGEILSGLESLRMNDSIIKCFRDLGTSFRFVRILHLARCGLKEVQGIQAFINLEELYISHNDIDDLFDIGFLEHLAVLDLEGNNVSSIDQLYYLNRCISLENLNLIGNPVQKELYYYEKLQAYTPNLLMLDDDLVVGSRFFENKGLQQQNKINIPQSISNFGNLPIIQRLQSIKISPILIQKLGQAGFQNIENDDDDQAIINQRIKEYDIEKKALRNFFEHIEEYIQDDQLESTMTTLRPRTPSQSLKLKQQSRCGTPQMFKTTTGSFGKYSTRKSSALSNENDQLAANQTQSSQSRLLILKRRPSQQTDNNDKMMPSEIKGLISNFDTAFIKERIQLKSRGRDVTKDLLTKPSESQIEQLLYNQPPFSKISGNDLRSSFSGNIPKRAGPIKAQIQVLKPSEISFSQSFKREPNLQK